MTSHLVIPDTQARQDTPDDHMEWAAKYALAHRPDVIIGMGDHWDMPSLSSYDSLHGKVAAGMDILGDIEAGNASLARFDNVLRQHNRRQKAKDRYHPRKVLLRGNHEHRMTRAVADDPMIAGFAREHPFLSPGWEVVEYLVPIVIDQISYAHFFPRAGNGCVVQDRRGSPSAKAQCVREGGSATAGHKQGLDVARITVGRGQVFRGLIAGSFYQGNAPAGYKGPQGHSYWRGILHCRNVSAGDYDLAEVSLEALRVAYAD